MEMNTYNVKTDGNGNIVYLDGGIPFTGHPEYEESEGLNVLLRNNPFSTLKFNLRFEPDYTGDSTLAEIKDSYFDDTLNMGYVAGIKALKARLTRNDPKNIIDALISETLAELEDATEKNKPYRLTANNDKVYEVTDDMIIESEYIPQVVPEAYGNKDENYFLIPLREGEVGDVPYAVVEAVESDEVIELSLDDLIFEDNTTTNTARNTASQYEVDVDLDNGEGVYDPSNEWEEWNEIINSVPIDNEDDTLRNSRPMPTVVKYLGQVQEPTTRYGRDTKHYDDDKLVLYNLIDTRMSPEESIIITEESFKPTQIIRNPLPNEKVSLIDRLKGMGKRYFTGRK